MLTAGAAGLPAGQRLSNARTRAHRPTLLQPGAVVRVAEGDGGAGDMARAAAAAEQRETLMAQQLRAGERLRVAAAVN